MQVIVDGLLTAFDASGKGKIVVLLPGWGEQAKDFQGLHLALSKKYKVIVPDLPGFGGTQNPKAAWGLDEYVNFINNFLKKVEVTSVYAFIGHSHGGAIVIRGLGQGILRADKLILLASAGIRGEYKGRIKMLRYLAKTGKALTAPLPANAKKRIRQKFYTSVGSDMLVAEHLQETFKKIISDDVRNDATNISIPTLLIYGETDTQTPVRYGELFHELIDGSTLEILPGAGHFVQIDRPHEVLKSITEYLS